MTNLAPIFRIPGELNTQLPNGDRPERHRAGTKGSSILNLLVTVAILAILATLISPQFSQMKAGALKVGCLSNLRQIGGAFSSYLAEHNDRLPATHSEGMIYNSSYHLPKDLAQYLSEAVGKYDPYVVSTALSWSRLWTCPANPWLARRNQTTTPYKHCSYLNNRNNNMFGNSTNPNNIVPSLTQSEIRQLPRKDRWLLRDIDSWNYGGEEAIGGIYDPVHNLGRNVLYLDGYVEWVRSNRLSTP